MTDRKDRVKIELMKTLLSISFLFLAFCPAFAAYGGLQKAVDRLSVSNSYCVYIEDTLSNEVLFSDDKQEIGNSPIPAGSVIKAFSIIAKYRNHPVDPGETYFCPGYDQDTPSVSKCWLKKGHGKIALLNAIAQSCNTYFYHFVQDVDFGLFLRTLREWGVLHGSDNWGRRTLTRDDQVRAMIGKLDIIRVKPLDLMVSYAKLFGRSGLPAEIKEVLTEGMSLCYRNGTASKARERLKMKEDLPVLCKTGTGMFEQDGEVSAQKTSGVFIGLYNGRYLVLALAQGSTGSDLASLLGLTVIREMAATAAFNKQGGDR
jgi:cell division protein FtsI/penicillin-binding protein 2